MEFSRPEYRSGEPFPPPGDLPNPGIEPRSPVLQADSLPAEPTETLWGVITPKSHDHAVPRSSLFFQYLPCYSLGCVGSRLWVQDLVAPAALLLPRTDSAVLFGLSQCSTWAPRPSAPVLSALGLRCSTAHGIFVVWPGIEPMSPPLQGRFFTPELPRKSRLSHLLLCPWTWVALVGGF